MCKMFERTLTTITDYNRIDKQRPHIIYTEMSVYISVSDNLSVFIIVKNWHTNADAIQHSLDTFTHMITRREPIVGA